MKHIDSKQLKNHSILLAQHFGVYILTVKSWGTLLEKVDCGEEYRPAQDAFDTMVNKYSGKKEEAA